MSVVVSDLPRLPHRATLFRLSPACLWSAALLFMFVCVALRFQFPALVKFPTLLQIPLGRYINSTLATVVPVLQPVTFAITRAFGMLLLAAQGALQLVPWPGVVVALAVSGFLLSGLRLGLFIIAALLYVVSTGYWAPAMNTFAIILIAVPVSVVIGFLIGVSGHVFGSLRPAITLIITVMQTIPATAYLLPLLLFFGFGPIPGLIATIVFAVPPMVHNTLLGLDQVEEELREAGTACGTTGAQRFLLVEFPAALPQLLVGVNQSTMWALSMVIMAAIIGGFQDIGWIVLTSLQKVEFGQSLLAGFVLSLLAMIVDRLTRAFATKAMHRRASSPLAWWVLLLPPGLVFAAILAGIPFPGLRAVPEAGGGLIDPEWLNAGVLSFVQAHAAGLNAFKNAVLYSLFLPLRLGAADLSRMLMGAKAVLPMFIVLWFAGWGGVAAWLLTTKRRGPAVAVVVLATLLYAGFPSFPWPAFILLLTLAGWTAGGIGVGLLALFSSLFIVVTGLYEPFTRSLYLLSVAVLVCVVVGGLIGVAAARSDAVSSVVRPVCDVLQTLPQFVLLIPALMFFKVGDFSGMIAIVLYAFAPPIRYVEHALRSVPDELKEVAKQTGCTPFQSLLLVELPAAMPGIVMGVNQTIMAALAMLPIAALVGTTELGQQVYMALGRANAGSGLIAGLAISLTALTADRIICSAIGKKTI
ncbi:MAG: ABC transporter permease subunit [Pararhizobium sp.]